MTGGALSATGVVGEVTAATPRRLRRLPSVELAGRRVPVATTWLARLLGLALLRRDRAGDGLLIPGSRSVHTVGMRFALDLVFIDAAGRPVDVRRRVEPGRLARQRRARAVLELPAGAGR